MPNPTAWEKRRAAMKEVCANCHAPAFADSFYTQYDGLIDLYHEKFAKPGSRSTRRPSPFSGRRSSRTRSTSRGTRSGITKGAGRVTASR
jgi:hypothetical protein